MSLPLVKVFNVCFWHKAVAGQCRLRDPKPALLVTNLSASVYAPLCEPTWLDFSLLAGLRSLF